MRGETDREPPPRKSERFVALSIPPIRRAVLAALGKRVRVALLCREGEKVAQLLERLDTALGTVMADDSVIDEVLPEIKRRRSR